MQRNIWCIQPVSYTHLAPNGKLPVTFYQGTENLPEFTDYSMAGRTYRYTDKNILYPFGYGLTYGTISYSGAKTEQETSAVLDDVTVCTKVKNESAYPLHESVEVYVKYKNAQPGEPGFQLKGIACVELQAGEEKEVSVTLHARDFAVITEDEMCIRDRNKCLIYYYGYGKILLWRKICLQLIKMVFPIRRQGKSCGENICEIRLIVL